MGGSCRGLAAEGLESPFSAQKSTVPIQLYLPPKTHTCIRILPAPSRQHADTVCWCAGNRVGGSTSLLLFEFLTLKMLKK